MAGKNTNLLAAAVLDAGAFDALQRQIKRLDTVRNVMDKIGAMLESRIHQRFDTKKNPEGHDWTPWSPFTAAQRKAEGRGTLLEYSGHMRDSLSYNVGADFVELGFGVPYAISHENGTRHIPKRRMIATGYGELSNKDMASVMKIIGDHLGV